MATTGNLTDFIKLQKALVVEDETSIAQLLKIHLADLGFDVDVCSTADTAEAFVAQNDYALCLLDWMMPGTQGVDFLMKYREKMPLTQFMMVTAKADADSIVKGLESGADDYLTKPFDSKVLAARVRHLMRRLQHEKSLRAQSQKPAAEELSYDGLHLDISKHIVRVDGVEVHLTPSEFKLLAELLKAQGQVLTRDRLIDLIQGQDVSVTGRTIDTHIFALRKKIGHWARYIETIRGVGYRILLSEHDQTENDPS